MKYSKLVVIFFVFCSYFAYSQENVFKNNKDRSTITYNMNHPLHEWSGTSKDIKSIVKIDKNSGQIDQVAALIPVKSFDSRNANRDSHMIEVLEGIKFPHVSFQSTKITISGDKADVIGVLTFHGIPKKIEFTADIEQSKKEIEASGNFVVKMSEYKIKAPSLMMIDADDAIKIHFDMFYDL